MRIDPEKCTGCESCIPYCTVGAIHVEKEKEISVIDQDECVECGVCHRATCARQMPFTRKLAAL
jgi:ferredoxin